MTLIVKIVKLVLGFLEYLRGEKAKEQAIDAVNDVPDHYVKPEAVKRPNVD